MRVVKCCGQQLERKHASSLSLSLEILHFWRLAPARTFFRAHPRPGHDFDRRRARKSVLYARAHADVHFGLIQSIFRPCQTCPLPLCRENLYNMRRLSKHRLYTRCIHNFIMCLAVFLFYINIEKKVYFCFLWNRK